MIDTMEKIFAFELIMARQAYHKSLPDYKKLEIIRTIECCESNLRNISTKYQSSEGVSK